MGKQQPAEYYDMIFKASGRYAQHYRATPYLSTWALVMQLIDNYSKSFLRREPHIIDIGCGPGQFAQFINDHVNASYLGLDFSIEAITRAKAMGESEKFNFEQIDLTTIRKFTGRFGADIFTSLETLEHIEADTKIIEAIPAGKLVIISVPTFDDEGHVRFFTSEDQVYRRYGQLLGTPLEPAIIERIRSWYIIYGTRNSTIPIDVNLE